MKLLFLIIGLSIPRTYPIEEVEVIHYNIKWQAGWDAGPFEKQIYLWDWYVWKPDCEEAMIILWPFDNSHGDYPEALYDGEYYNLFFRGKLIKAKRVWHTETQNINLYPPHPGGRIWRLRK